MIILADERDRPVYPEEYLDETLTPLWHDLEVIESLELPKRPEGEDSRDPQTFTVTVTQSGSSVIIPFEKVYTSAEGFTDFNAEFCLPVDFRTDPKRYAIRKVTAIMKNGATEHKIVVRSAKAQDTGYEYPFELDETARLHIPYVTGNIEINIDVVEYCHVTVTGPTDHITSFPVIVQKGSSGGLQLTSLIESGREIQSAKAYRNEEFLGELYDEKYGLIRFRKELMTDDFEIVVELAPIDQTPEPTE